MNNGIHADDCDDSSALHIGPSPVPWSGSTQGDILFEVGDRKLPVFRAVLRVRCPLMADVVRPATTNRFVVTGVRPDIFETLLAYITTGRVPHGTMANCAQPLMVAAEKFAVYKLVDECRVYVPSWD